MHDVFHEKRRQHSGYYCFDGSHADAEKR